MTTVAEILQAVEHLDENEQQEFVEKLNVLLTKSRSHDFSNDEYELPADFTERLSDAFNEARRAAIQRGTK